jgi:hypothetical protein
MWRTAPSILGRLNSCVPYPGTQTNILAGRHVCFPPQPHITRLFCTTTEYVLSLSTRLPVSAVSYTCRSRPTDRGKFKLSLIA